MAHRAPILPRKRARVHGTTPDAGATRGTGKPSNAAPTPENGPPSNLWDGQGTLDTQVFHHAAFGPVGAQAKIFYHDGKARIVWATPTRGQQEGHKNGAAVVQEGWSAGPSPAGPHPSRLDTLRAQAWRCLLRIPARAAGTLAAVVAAAACGAALLGLGEVAGLPLWATAIGALAPAALAGLYARAAARESWAGLRRDRLEPIALLLARHLDADALDGASWRALGPALRAQQDWAHPASSDHDGTEGDGVWHIEAAWRARSHGLEMINAHLVPWRWQRTPPHKRLKLWAYLSRKTLHDLDHPASTPGPAILEPPAMFPHLAPQDAEWLWAQGWEAMGGWTWKTAPFPTATAHQRLALLRAAIQQSGHAATSHTASNAHPTPPASPSSATPQGR